jgi:hypothetical protein
LKLINQQKGTLMSDTIKDCNSIEADLRELIGMRDELLTQRAIMPVTRKLIFKEDYDDPDVVASDYLNRKISALNSVIYRFQGIIEQRKDEKSPIREGDIVISLKNVRQYEVFAVHPEYIFVTAIGTKKLAYMSFKSGEFTRVIY